MQENDFKDFTEQNMQQHFRKHFRLDFPPGGRILSHLMETPLKEKSRIVRDGHLANIALFAIGFQGKEDFGEGENLDTWCLKTDLSFRCDRHIFS